MGKTLKQSSLTKKFVMAFAGLFLILFLFVHLGINLLVLLPSTESFNLASHFMGTNIVIKIFEVVLFGGIFIHIIYGLILQIQNWMARPIRYKIEGWSHSSPFSKFMIHTAIVILVFLVIHLIDFYIKTKFLGEVDEIMIDGKMYHDLAGRVIQEFHITWVVVVYIFAFIILGLHLHHGFESAFQSLGWNHSRYFQWVKNLSLIISIFLTVGFIIIPLIIYFGNY